jgi:hypothetical protein
LLVVQIMYCTCLFSIFYYCSFYIDIVR